MSNEKKNELLKRVYDLINKGEGVTYLEVDGAEAKAIFEEIRKMRERGEIV